MAKKNYAKARKPKYSAAEKRAYWIGVGAGLGNNQNGIPYHEMRRSIIKTGAESESFSAGFKKSYDKK